jgi:SAM-dependent methyltransferase
VEQAAAGEPGRVLCPYLTSSGRAVTVQDGIVDSDEWDRRYAVDEFVWDTGPNRFVAEELSGLPPGLALDLASGEGRNAVWLAGRGWRVTAVDFSGVALAKARKLAGDRGVTVEWVLADLHDYEPPRGRYDLVVIAYLHLQPAGRAAVLHRAARSLAPHGTAFVVGHDLDNLAHGTGGPQDPAVLYTSQAIAAELPGLMVKRAGRVHRPVDTGDGVRQAIDTLVLAARPE